MKEREDQVKPWYVDQDGWCLLCGTAPNERHQTQIGYQEFALNGVTCTREEFAAKCGAFDGNGHSPSESRITSQMYDRVALRKLNMR
jgi:hypothetical protein